MRPYDLMLGLGGSTTLLKAAQSARSKTPMAY